ncbi:MAG: putative quinol monooxygenase [Cyanobacteriota bacterium]|nr:putative quinol monooxygenase [Cyanobacteriota bacterium]
MSHSTLHVVARIVAYPDKIEELKAVLLELLEPTRQEPGCIQYDLLQNKADPTDFTFVERWESEANLEAHLTTEHIKVASQKINGLVAAGPDVRRYSFLSSEL